MKKIFAAVLILGVVVLAAPSVVRAFEPSVANVPFSFIVAGQMMPAGDYRVSVIQGVPDVLQIVNTNGRSQVLTAVEPADAPEFVESGPTEFSFRKVGDQYFLARVDIKGQDSVTIPLSDSSIAKSLQQVAAQVGR